MADGGRDFDVIVWGATGFVGKLVCQRLAQLYQGEVRWAMGGRNKEKLEGVRDAVAAVNGAAKDTEILLGDIKDQQSLEAIARRTKVIIAMAGPYNIMGEPIVAACVREGTHYVDITGEPWYIRRIMDKFHDEAAAKNVRIVPCCGYDSIPSDIGTFFVVDHIKRQLGKETAGVRMLAVAGAGGVSGGTVDSLLGVKDIPSAERHAVGHPYCLNPPDKRQGPDPKDSFGVGWIPELQQRTFPFIMAPINTRVVRRSAALVGSDGQSSSFSYGESVPAPRPGIVMAPLITGVMGLGLGALISPGIGPFLRKRLLPAAGAGPDEKTRETNHWRHIYLATVQGESQATVQAEAYGKGDPGYGSTHRMVLEAALCLALQLDDCEKAGRVKGGILTPASAMGPVLVDRLQQKAEVTFSISPAVGARGQSKM
jgi:short subunit dehydrogenase-like uncharacterized protein